MEIERHQGKVFKSSQNHFCTAGLDHEQLAGLRRDRLCHNRSGTQTQGGAYFNFYTLVTSFESRESAASSCRSHQPGSVWEQRRRNLGSGAPPLPTSSLRWDQTFSEAELCCSQNVDYPHFLIFSGRWHPPRESLGKGGRGFQDCDGDSRRRKDSRCCSSQFPCFKDQAFTFSTTNLIYKNIFFDRPCILGRWHCSRRFTASPGSCDEQNCDKPGATLKRDIFFACEDFPSF